MSGRSRHLLLLLASPVVCSESVNITLCKTPESCGHIKAPANCGSDDVVGGFKRFDSATICLGFQSANSSAADGTKALFEVKVDSFSELRVDTRARDPFTRLCL